MSGIRVAIVHYHLRPGGVTRIIQHSLDALEDRVQAVVLVAPDQHNQVVESPNAITAYLPSLAYETAAQSFDPDRLYNSLIHEANTALGGMPDVWHIHNHSLGKNAALSMVTHRLAREGHPLLLHIHDYAEDRRPTNYLFLSDRFRAYGMEDVASVLYPVADHVHYGVLNGRDGRFMQAAGIPVTQLHTLANPVSLKAGSPPEANQDHRLFLYPTRAIRRKNMGEFLLWSALAEPGDVFATTLAPLNPEARPVYEAWKEFADRLTLPVEFEKGQRWQGPFIELLQSSYRLVTTSVAEGFGLAFLEPWLAGKSVVGRRIPEITTDFLQQGIDLSGLYDELYVPLAWIDLNRLREQIGFAYRDAMQAFQRECSDEDIQSAFDSVCVKDTIAFSALDETEQMRVIEHLAASPDARSEISPRQLVVQHDVHDVIESNRKTVMAQYNISNYGDHLSTVYQTIMASKPGALATIEPNALLNQFLDPARFRLLLS